MPITWKWSFHWNANWLYTWALSPSPVSSSIVSPVPPQSMTCRFTLGATVTNRSVWGVLSTHADGAAARVVSIAQRENNNQKVHRYRVCVILPFPLALHAFGKKIGL